MDQPISGQAARKAREAKRLSQAAVAEAVGINRMYYSLFESGRFLLDAEEQERLAAYFVENGIRIPRAAANPQRGVLAAKRTSSAVGAVAARQPESESEDRDDSTAEEAQENSAEPDPVSLAECALVRLRSALEDSQRQRDSRRVAKAVEEALPTLGALDFDELLRLAEGREVSTEGLPSVKDFAALELAEKELWEARAAGLLVCAELYGDEWERAACRDLERVGRSLRERFGGSDSWQVRGRSLLDELFKDSDEFCPRYRCDLAPYIAKAAQERRAPALLAAAK